MVMGEILRNSGSFRRKDISFSFLNKYIDIYKTRHIFGGALWNEMKWHRNTCSVGESGKLWALKRCKRMGAEPKILYSNTVLFD